MRLMLQRRHDDSVRTITFNKSVEYILADSENNNGSLSDDAQNILTKLLINNLFQDKCKGSDLYFRKISKLIVEVFPQEKERVYFIPSKSEGTHQCHAKGKLIERWKNVARRLRSVGAIELGRKKTTSNSIEPVAVFSDDLKAAKLWLQEEGLSANFDSVKDKWRLTYNIRKSEILNADSKVTVYDVFLNWPILKSLRGYELISEDFNILYPTQQELFPDWSSFLNKWIFISDRLVSVRKNSVKDKVAKDLLKQLDHVQQSGNIGVANILKCQLIPYLLPTKTIIRSTDLKSAKKNWKPSCGESAAAFIVHIANITQLESEIQQRRVKYIQYGAHVQPYIIISGKDIFSIDQCYVRVDNHLWYFNCPLKAIDLCFKSYFSFNCAYPRECHESWMFLQLHLYGLNTDHDLMTAVLSSINDKFT
ncbi:unnamed protein product [Macrosiphum euphorbiae]|uniref:Uncharacterized protein n=1 Tax=Macrosiphum euphorbiae TaxID=13131 RepID=A0AAV0WK83_9HEMI|nr:unnamed protein product [Macrosiphum euphorbiae]